MKTRICIAGATGKMGGHVAKAIAESQEFEIVSAVAKNYNGRDLGEILHLSNVKAEIYDDIVFALQKHPDILVDFSHPDIVMRNVTYALQQKVSVVVGTSGLTEEDLVVIGELAKTQETGIIVSGNFSVSAVLMMQFASMAAKYFPGWEIIEYSYDGKQDAPSGTARELASKLAVVKQPGSKIPVDKISGDPLSRGANINGTQIHSVRLPGFNNSCEIIFGTGAERLKIRHDAIDPTKPYIDGAMLAIRKVRSVKGLYRGLDAILQL
jgi:4-hydroxy-tetrahydrodipicolinate reductase